MGSSNNVWAALRPLSSAHTTGLRGCFEENPRTQLRLAHRDVFYQYINNHHRYLKIRLPYVMHLGALIQMS